MKAILEVEFDPDFMFDEKAIKEEFGGDWTKAMKWLFRYESIGIFDKEIRLVEVKP